MDDQVSNLQAKGVVAEQIHGASTQSEINSILKRMEGKIPNEASPKLVYVTPERLDKSKNFIASLQRMHDSGLLKRFCVDEAHCVSTLGHDYRTSYLALRRLKSLFPSVPILATTATAPSSVIAEMLKALALPLKTSPGGAALPNTTVLFQSPLYRSNLLYDVRPKPQAAKDQTRAIIDYIEEHHDGHTGIIYCLTRADAENCTKAIREGSTLIKAATYHAQLDNSERARVQDLWRRKKIHCVVATNASFGLGIDNPSVRYVIHASLPKSLSNFYQVREMLLGLAPCVLYADRRSSHFQESGRAGRDGLNSDCVLFYRAADASRISTLTYETYHTGGKEKRE